MYKRQVKIIVPCAAITLVGRGMRSLLHKLQDVWAMFGRERVHLISQSSNDLNLTFVAVSYTHLDVYKRQAQMRFVGQFYQPPAPATVH